MSFRRRRNAHSIGRRPILSYGRSRMAIRPAWPCGGRSADGDTPPEGAEHPQDAYQQDGPEKRYRESGHARLGVEAERAPDPMSQQGADHADEDVRDDAHLR